MDKINVRPVIRSDESKRTVEVKLTLSLDQTLALASLLAYVGDGETGCLGGLYDAIGDALEYNENGEPIPYSLSRAIDAKHDWTRKFYERGLSYFTR